VRCGRVWHTEVALFHPSFLLLGLITRVASARRLGRGRGAARRRARGGRPLPLAGSRPGAGRGLRGFVVEARALAGRGGGRRGVAPARAYAGRRHFFVTSEIRVLLE